MLLAYKKMWTIKFVRLSGRVVGSIPDDVIGFFNWPNTSSRTMALGKIQLLKERSTRNLPRRRDNVVGIVTGYSLDDQEVGVRAPEGQEFFFWTSSRPALGSTQALIQRLPGTLSLGLKRSAREADHSPPTSANVKKCGSLDPLPHTPSWSSV
jgi:hypothetical protein